MSKEAEKEDVRSSQNNTADPSLDAPVKKRRLINGAELVFKKPGDASDDGTDEEGPVPAKQEEEAPTVTENQHRLVETSRITIVEDN